MPELSTYRKTAQESKQLHPRVEDIRIALLRITQNKLSLVGIAIVTSLFILAAFADLIIPHPETLYSPNFENRLQPPSWNHPFGTDHVGRDVLTRVIYGSRTSLMMGVTVLTMAITLGVSLGLVAGYEGKAPGAVIMRITDIFLSIPYIALVLAVTAALGASLTNAILAITFVWWPGYTRLVYGQVLSLKEELFVEAGRAIGAGRIRIMFRDILPNLVPTLVVKATIDFGFAVLIGATLGFLGLGAQEPMPEWGVMIQRARPYIPEIWWPVTFPGLATFVTVIGFNLLGDGLNDAFGLETKS